MEKQLVEFKCTVVKERYNSENYKIYVVDVDKNIYPNVKSNGKGEYILVGNIPNLIPTLEYSIQAYVNINSKFGLQYSVKNVSQDKATDLESSRRFLNAIINPNYVDELLTVYPNIIDKIIKNDLNDIDLTKIKGVGDYTFNKIKEKVIKNYTLLDLVDYFNGLIPMSTIQKLYDKYTSVNIVKKQIQHNPYKCLCSLSRIGFKSADGILLELDEESKKNKECKFKFVEDLLTSKQRMKACINYILEQNELSGNTKISIQQLRKESAKLTPECIDKFVEVIKDNDKDIYVNNELKCISSNRAYETEKYISEKINELLNNRNVWNINTELYRESKDGFVITDEQMGALEMICNNSIGILTAVAGSGKTASTNNILDMLDNNNKSYILMTPTGKSSEVLANQTKREAGTIHRQLKYKPTGEEGKNPWGYNEKNKLQCDVVVIDEFSMADIYLFKHVLDAIDTSNTKLLLVFDSYQLASVGCGNLAQDFLDSNIIPVTRLTKIFRYGEGGLMQVVTKIRNGEQFLPSDFTGVKIFGEKKDFIYVELQQQKIVNQVLKVYSKMLDDGYDIEDIVVLACQNKGDLGTKEINKKIQYFMQKDKKNKFIISGDNRFFKDDKVMQVINNYKATTPTGEETDVFNGNTGIIVDIGWDELIVDFGNGKLIQYSKNDLNQLELGYCISDHKSQGMSVKQVICVAPKAHTFMLNSNLLYVAGTRARERVYMIGNIVTINKAINKKENLNRDTWMVDFLENNIA